MSKTTPREDDQFRSLLGTVERLRSERFSHLDAGLVEEILRVHADPAAADADLARSVEQAVERHLAKEQ